MPQEIKTDFPPHDWKVTPTQAAEFHSFRASARHWPKCAVSAELGETFSYLYAHDVLGYIALLHPDSKGMAQGHDALYFDPKTFQLVVVEAKGQFAKESKAQQKPTWSMTVSENIATDEGVYKRASPEEQHVADQILRRFFTEGLRARYELHHTMVEPNGACWTRIERQVNLYSHWKDRSDLVPEHEITAEAVPGTLVVRKIEEPVPNPVPLGPPVKRAAAAAATAAAAVAAATGTVAAGSTAATGATGAAGATGVAVTAGGTTGAVGLTGHVVVNSITSAAIVAAADEIAVAIKTAQTAEEACEVVSTAFPQLGQPILQTIRAGIFANAAISLVAPHAAEAAGKPAPEKHDEKPAPDPAGGAAANQHEADVEPQRPDPRKKPAHRQRGAAPLVDDDDDGLGGRQQ